ncbi:hypothetical protein AYI68_g4553 [Smittium mucronatum]|uniref:Uncharacterized protein n=1 Tax=Smittium mucronatum TaxID=133383 RepID=A0A1R0GWR6_9FUNG|nr:hypothetical protein AYI68_g4553 [Smittium mucronatum]
MPTERPPSPDIASSKRVTEVTCSQELSSLICLRCGKRSAPPVFICPSSGVTVLRIAVRYLHCSIENITTPRGILV